MDRPNINVKSEPFFHAWVKGFLPDDLYKKLSEAFPAVESLSERTKNKKLRLCSHIHPDEFWVFIKDHPVWQELIDGLSSDQFLETLHTLVAPELRRVRATPETREEMQSWLARRLPPDRGRLDPSESPR
jgi:hypothetical protein